MKAVRWHARGDVRLDDLDVPEPRLGEVLIRVEAAAICATDMEEVKRGPINVPVSPHPTSGRVAPITLGHEVFGVVEEAGPRSSVPVGSRVAPWPLDPCGRCRDCLSGHANRCPYLVALGMSADGGMADFMVVDADRCAPLPSDVELERAVLVEPFAVALHAMHQVDVEGARVAVVGTGSLGLCLVEAATFAGAAETFAFDPSDVCRDLARAAGATEALPVERAGECDAEVVFEAAGTGSALGVSLAAVRRGGQVVVLGAHTDSSGLNLFDVATREVDVRGSVSHCFERDFVAAARLIGEGRLARVRRPITLLPLSEGPARLREPGDSRKTILIPGERIGTA